MRPCSSRAWPSPPANAWPRSRLACCAVTRLFDRFSMTQTFIQTFILLILVTDPFGNVPLFVSALAQVPKARRWKVVVRECLIAYGVLLLFMFFGSHLLSAMQLSEISLRIG